MRAEGRFSLRLFAAFSLSAAAFLASSMYVNWRILQIEKEASALTSDVLPSLDHLSRAVDALRDVEAIGGAPEALSPEARAELRPRIQEVWRGVDAQLSAYLSTPRSPDEQQLYDQLPGELRALDGAIDRLVVAAEAGGPVPVELRRAVRVRTDAAAQVLRGLARMDAERVLGASMRGRAARYRVAATAGFLNAVTLLVTVCIGFWVWRVFRDYARLQQRHAGLLQRRADELEVFGRRVAHDLISPLSSLTFCLTVFKGASESDPRLAIGLARARTCVQLAQELVDNVFDFARSGGAPSPDASAYVPDIVHRVVEEARSMDADERLAIDVDLVPECYARCSRGVLTSILGNLVHNAIKFTRELPLRLISIRVLESGGDVHFEVEDTGPGIPHGLEEAIFQPYVRGEGTTQPGLGLGLATVRHFCEAHGGRVGVRPADGRGSIFFFTLPRAPVAADSVPPPVSSRTNRARRKETLMTTTQA